MFPSIRSRFSFFVLGTALLSVMALFALSVPALAQTEDGTTVPEQSPVSTGLSVVYETTLVETGFEGGRDIAVDANDNAYVIARSYDTNNDLLVVKLDPAGNVVWTKLIAGNGHDFGTGIVADNNGDVYIVGTTHSSDFPVVNAYQPTRNGFVDAFLLKLSGQDGSIIFSTYFGGSRAEYSGDIAFDPNGNLVITGQTDSTDFPTVNPLQPNLNLSTCFCDDVFVSTFSADGGTLLYSTYLGGGLTDEGISVDVDAAGNIYLTGVTESPDFPLINPLDNSYGGDRDGFAARISSDGSTLDYSTYLGGNDWDLPKRLVVNDAGYAHIVGETRSPDFPTTAGAFQEQFVGGILDCGSAGFDLRNCTDVFVTKIAPDGSDYAFSTFIGGGLDDAGNGIALDSNGRIHLVGYSQSGDFPPLNGTSPTAFIFVSELDATGSTLAYTEAINSPVANDGHGIALDDMGDIYITGAQNVPSDLYIARLSNDQSTLVPFVVSDIGLTVKSRQGIHRITGRVMVQDVNGQPVPNASANATWTYPNGKVVQQTALTDSQGWASFRIYSRQTGLYTLHIDDVSKTGYLFDAANSLLTATIQVGNSSTTDRLPPITDPHR